MRTRSSLNHDRACHPTRSRALTGFRARAALLVTAFNSLTPILPGAPVIEPRKGLRLIPELRTFKPRCRAINSMYSWTGGDLWYRPPGRSGVASP